MELFRRWRANVLAQLHNKFGYHPSWTISIVLAFHKCCILGHLGKYEPSSTTKELLVTEF